MLINPKNILKLLTVAFEQPEYNLESSINDDERAFSSQLEILIKDSIDNSLFIETHDTLQFEEDHLIIQSEPCAIEDSDDNTFEIETNSNFQLHECEDKEIDEEYKQKAVEYWKSGKKRKLKFETVKIRFKRLTSKCQLYRWEEQIARGGNRLEKLKKISEIVLDQFKEAVKKSVTVHDLDIRKWALQAQDEVSLSSNLFTASVKWVNEFKHRHGIVSRKINKFVTQKSIADKNQLEASANEFVENVKQQILLVEKENIFNSDQSGFNLEMHTGRTLAFKGTQTVESLAQSINSMTHSYTIQPLISANGVLLSPLLIVLQEKNGTFGPIVQNNLFKSENVLVKASNSGKLTSSLVRSWFQEVFLPASNEKSILLLDSWSGQNSSTFEPILRTKEYLKIETIPAGTTGRIQPLDVFFFRPWKNFLRHFSDIVILYNYNINLHLRNNIIKIQSLIHNQFSSPRFSNLISYAWYKSGYLEEKPPEFENPVKFCFKDCAAFCDLCTVIAVIRCAWCKKFLCITHFFTEYHYCKNYSQ